MIELNFTGMCKGCQCADLTVELVHVIGEGNVWYARCSHYTACNHMQDKTIERLMEGKINNATKGCSSN